MRRGPRRATASRAQRDADDARLRSRRTLVLQRARPRGRLSRCRGRHLCHRHVGVHDEHTVAGGETVLGHGAARLHPGKRRRIVP